MWQGVALAASDLGIHRDVVADAVFEGIAVLQGVDLGVPVIAALLVQMVMRR